MGVLRIYLLGGLSLAWEDVSLKLPNSAAARSLLAYLVVYRDRAHTRGLLAGVFWPDLPEPTAKRRLSQALWQLRSALQAQPFLIAEGDCLQVNPQLALWVDVEEFSQGAGSAPKTAEALEACLALYRGEFLAGYYEDWALLERERLRDLYLAALEQLAAIYKGRGDHAQALTCIRTLVSQDPWREEAQREMMRLLNLTDQGAEALKQYEAYQQALEDELGIDPAPETRALAYEIAGRAGLNVQPWLPSAARSGQSPLFACPDRLPLVGRQVELAELLRLVEAAQRGVGGLALIYGEAGVGKTRLLQELARNAEWRGLCVAWGRCYELDVPPAYQPLIEVFRAHLPALNENTLEALWRAELARLLPELAAGVASPELKPEEAQRRLMEAVARGFLALGKTAPSLVILEDAQWMDQASLAALRYLLPRLAEAALLIVVSVRSEEVSPQHAEALAALQNTRLPRRLDVHRLSREETGELVQHALALDQPPTLFSARLYLETEGNPFFVTETLRVLVDDGLLYRDAAGDWSTPWDDASENYAKMPLPASVAQSIQRRLERLPIPLAEALGMAAVIGRGVSFDVWQRAAQRTEADLLAVSDELCRRGLLLCAGDSPPSAVFASAFAGADYIFAHDQIRRVVFERLAAPRRRTYHRSIAEALTQLSPDKPDALAYHWSAAQVWDKAVEYHQQAGERALHIYALEEALKHFMQALDGLKRLPGAPDLPREYALHLGCERIYDLQGARQAQSEELAALAALAETLGDRRRQAETALRQARQADLTSDFPGTIAASSRAVELAQAAQDAVIEIEGRMEWGWALLLQGDHPAAQTQFEAALALARQAGLRRLEADGLHGLGTICLVTGQYAAAKGYFEQVLEIALRVDIRPRQASALANLGYIASAQGEQAASREYNQQALAIHRQTGDQRSAALVMQNLADVYLADGDFTAAMQHLEQALAIQQATQAQENVGGCLGVLGVLFHRLGEYAQARKYYAQAMQIFEQLGIRWYQGQNLAFLSLLHHHLGENEAAQECSRQGLEIAREISDRLAEGWLLDCLGHALAGLGEFDQAEQAYRQAFDLRQAQNEPQKAAESLAGLARVALEKRNIAVAREYVEAILRILEEKGLAAANEPFRIYLTCFQVLVACQDDRAGEILTGAYTELMRQKTAIQDDRLERSFVENVAANRELIAAYAARQAQVSLPRRGAPGGRALRPDEYIPVNWEIAVLEDERIPGKTARRQHRLRRLLEQAEQQGAVPTYEHLAQALGVTQRTIKRDMQTLRRQKADKPL